MVLLVFHVLFLFCLAMLFAETGGSSQNFDLMVLCTSFLTPSTLMVDFHTELPVVRREVVSGFYWLPTWFLARNLCDLPIVIPSLGLSITIVMGYIVDRVSAGTSTVRLRHCPSQFIAIIILFHWACHGLGYVAAACFRGRREAITSEVAVMLLLLTCSNYFMVRCVFGGRPPS
ncbi:MAG: hypothetical protein KVP17_003805 [Porospora cf. gigantea B]|uniref:uncharacterized protein n=1 Tax=Porospora cf. gigantea B TaxID=2853592 RepID=UPI003571E864|nr:MAG: hypothetical protein KVP17_003805 [Porospora cf. gigantea B]